MRLDRRTRIQLGVFFVVAVVAGAVMAFNVIRVPALWFGIGEYRVTVDLPQAAGLYPRANVTYRGTEVGTVKDVRLSDTGVQAVLALRADIDIPADLEARVHSVSGVGEQYVALLPRDGAGPSLKDGDVIPVVDTQVPPDINDLLNATNAGLRAIPNDNVKTLVDESATAVGGLGPEIARIVRGSTQLAIDARNNLDPWMALVDNAKPVLDSQVDTTDEIHSWAANLATIADQIRNRDDDVAGLIAQGGPAAEEARGLIERLQPTLPILTANLVGINDVAITYQPAIEQVLVLLPQGTAGMQASILANMNSKLDYKGSYLNFNLQPGNPPVCMTGFLPPQQMRSPVEVDFPERPAGDLYCRTPQDSDLVTARGAKNYPCITRPGKRAPTVKMCESDEQYVPLNDGTNWKGDPNATLSGQDIPQLPPGVESAHADAAAPAPIAVPPPPPLGEQIGPIATAQYDPATGTYLGPDGRIYTQADLGNVAKEQTWQSMLIPPNN